VTDANRAKRGPEVAYTIAADVCEGIADCLPLCPAECIHWGEGRNAKGTEWVYIDAGKCTGCGACASFCPVEGAIVNRWVPDLQEPHASLGGCGVL
jgi:NAD-dependent dihydropyrimidine dehydrogenase PreA subunit